jgi:hypothetical protein
MAWRYTVRCPDCGEKWSVVADRLPDFCQSCGSYVGTDPDFVPSKLNIGGSALARATDQAYRDLEASPAGITDLKDNLREGDVAAKPVQPSQEYLQQVKGMAPDYNPWQAGIGMTTDAIAMSKKGRERTTGAKAIGAIQAATTGVPQPPPGLKGQWGNG